MGGRAAGGSIEREAGKDGGEGSGAVAVQDVGRLVRRGEETEETEEGEEGEEAGEQQQPPQSGEDRH